MTKHLSRHIRTDVLIILASAVMITIAATSLSEPVRAGIAASIPTPFHFAMERTLAPAEPSTAKLARAQSRCRNRSAPLQWNIDWLNQSPGARG
jgi:hypothetical protein